MPKYPMTINIDHQCLYSKIRYYMKQFDHVTKMPLHILIYHQPFYYIKAKQAELLISYKKYLFQETEFSSQKYLVFIGFCTNFECLSFTIMF